jgi:DNA-directed RNA polymerase
MSIVEPRKLKKLDKATIALTLELRVVSEISNHNPLKFLKLFETSEYIAQVISVFYLYTRPKRGSTQLIYFSELVTAVGNAVRSKLKLKKDSSLAAKTGAFILYTFEQLELIVVTLGQGPNGHNTYIVNILNDEAICDLWSSLGSPQIEKMPALLPYAPWDSFRHKTGLSIVKTGNRGVLESLSPQTHPIVFECLNRAQQVGWQVNKEVFKIHAWALKNKVEAFADIWEQQNPQAKATKLREARTIGEIAKRFLNQTFYHLYYYDFRGRKYPTTAYLHEQGSDFARGLLLRADAKALGEGGYFWLLVSLGSLWAGESGRPDGAKTDKIPLKDRKKWALDNEDTLLSYAENPKVNQGWMRADKPWQFLATCIELKNLRIHQYHRGDFEDYSYESKLECFIDGTNNGAQHLAALTRDELTAHHVNLMPLEFPGDLYRYVGEHVWEFISKEVSKLSEAEVEAANKFIDQLILIKREINEAEIGSEKRATLVEKIKIFKHQNEDIAPKSSPVFWMRIKDIKQRRKTVKRNVISLPYGGTPYGLGEQQISDAKKHGIELLLYMEHRWGAYLGRVVFSDCKDSLQKPMQLLHIFEKAGKDAEDRGEFLSWTVPITNFPVVQNYTEGSVKKVWIQYGPPRGQRKSTGFYENTLQISICFPEEPIIAKGKQSQGASPNIIHSLDAAHLMLTVHKCPFVVTTVHDSFGCHFADMPLLYRTIRETFLELYKENPLFSIIDDIQGDINGLELGTLDMNWVLHSEYCFS